MTVGFLWHWFDFPGGSVLTNLVASVIWASLILWRLIKHMRGVHQHLDDVHEHLRMVHEHVAQVRAHQLTHQAKR